MANVAIITVGDNGSNGERVDGKGVAILKGQESECIR